MLVDVLTKNSHQNMFHVIDSEVFVGQSGNQPFSPLLCRARFSHQHPAWHIIDRQQIYLIVLESLDALLESRDVVSDTLAPLPPELVRGKEHLEAFTLFFLWSLL